MNGIPKGAPCLAITLHKTIVGADIIRPLRGRPLLQGVPSPKIIHWIIFEFTPCGAPSYLGALPRTPQGLSALDLTKGTMSLLNPIQGRKNIYILKCDRKAVYLDSRIVNVDKETSSALDYAGAYLVSR